MAFISYSVNMLDYIDCQILTQLELPGYNIPGHAGLFFL